MTATAHPAMASRRQMGRGPMPWDRGPMRTRITRPIGVPGPPITLAATSLPITEIPARVRASASPMDATRIA
jgi:hypothetical protein